MVFKPQIQMRKLGKDQDRLEERHKAFPQFKSTQYQDPSPFPQRPERWYNGSLMGKCQSQSSLFGPKGRLRSLHTKITSQETPRSDFRGQFYRFIGDLLCQFFPIAILDPIIEDLVSLESLRLPQEIDKAICIVLAALEMHLRKYNRTILKERVISEIADELGVDVDRKKLVGAKWFLARGGFWKEHLSDINTATYEILQNLTFEIITNFPFLPQNNVADFRRQLYHQCIALINFLAEKRRHPQELEIHAHVIASLAAETLLNKPVLTSEIVGTPQLNTRVYRAKRQFQEMLGSK
ncbi:MAG: hypothetical protein ACFFB3_14825 [Candidatus Hodarchaeota archaeon]